MNTDRTHTRATEATTTPHTATTEMRLMALCDLREKIYLTAILVESQLIAEECYSASGVSEPG